MPPSPSDSQSSLDELSGAFFQFLTEVDADRTLCIRHAPSTILKSLSWPVRRKQETATGRCDASRKGQDAGRGTLRSARPGTGTSQGTGQGLVPGLECHP